MKAVCDKTFTLQPVAGPLDLTSSPDAVPFGGYRYVENFETNPQDKKMRRMTGYQRFLPTELYENADLHYRYGLPRQHLTFGFEAKTPIGFTKLFAATQNTLFAKNNATQQWSPIWDGFGGDPNLNGCSEVIMQAANVNSTVLLSNDFDDPVYHVIDQPANGDGSFVQPIPDFQTLKITRVGFLYAWNNLVIAANVVMDGVRQTNLLLWSDYKKPISFVPNKDSSLAGRKFLAYGEVILNAAELADALMLYTNRGVWEMRVSDASDADGNPVVLSFTKRYTPDKAGSRCLKFKRTLVTTGDDHYYAGQDGIYKYNFYMPRPEIEEWSRRAASHLFINNTLNKARCATHCAGYDTTKKAYWFSYAKMGDQCNSETLVMNTETHFSSVIKEGFSFFLNHNPRNLMGLRQWIIDNCICQAGAPCTATTTYGENLLSGSYDGDGNFTGPILDQDLSYRWIPGDNDDIFFNASEFTFDHEEYTEETVFTPIDSSTYLRGTPSSPVTGSLQEVIPASGLNAAGDSCDDIIPVQEGCIASSVSACPVTYGENIGTGVYGDEDAVVYLTVVAGRSYRWVKGVNEILLSNGIFSDPGFVQYHSSLVFVAVSNLVFLRGTANGLPVTGSLQEVTYSEPESGSGGRLGNYTSSSSYTLHGITAEDWRATPDEDSIRTRLAGVTVQDLCGSAFTSDECSTGTLFIMAAVADRCIKQLSDVLYRERCVGFERCGVYENRGYISIARSGPISLSAPTSDKTWIRFNAEAEPDTAVIPGRMSLRVGVAATALDPNQLSCPIYWETLMDPETGEPFKLQCLSDKTEAQHEADGTRPDKRYEWPLFHAGKFHYFEIVIHNQDSTPLDVGAGVAISRMEFDARLEC